MSFFEEYEKAINDAFTSNPTVYLDELLGEDNSIDSVDVIKLIVGLEATWRQYKKYEVTFAVVIDKCGDDSVKDSIFKYRFEDDIKNVIQNGNKGIYIYTIDKSGRIIEKSMHNSCDYKKVAAISHCNRVVAFYLGANGVDVLVNGVVFRADNHLDSYKDMIYLEMKSVYEYKQLLSEFFHNKVQYDPFKRYFIEKGKYPKSLHDILDKHPKALYPKPEKVFQVDLVDFLHNKCRDVVLKEVQNASEERYDVWILSEDKKLFVFEIKWLGKSITPEGSVFNKYDNEERAIEGSYQLKDYVDNAEKYAMLGKDNKIYCGVLVTFDAREVYEDIEYDEIFKKYPQIDLSQQFKIDKRKIKASQVYKTMKKKARSN